MISRRPVAPTSRSVPRRLWIVGTLFLLAPSVAFWFSTPAPSVPATPVDRVNALYARQWVLLQGAREVIPPGQTFTTIARDQDEEMLLFMLSLGVLTKQAAVPSSYFKDAVSEGADARYVISYECFEPRGAILLRRLPFGCVWERPGPRP